MSLNLDIPEKQGKKSSKNEKGTEIGTPSKINGRNKPIVKDAPKKLTSNKDVSKEPKEIPKSSDDIIGNMTKIKLYF